MSNFLAIATVTATLRDILFDSILADVSGADVTTVRPVTGANTPKVGANIYLYQITPNVAFRNSDLPTRGSNGDLSQKPTAALDLHYLLTFYGEDTRLEPQRVLGSVVRTLHAQPVITAKAIKTTIANALSNPDLSFLSNSNLADSIESVKLTQMPLSLEELSKLWSVFYQIPYMLSLAYQAAVVFIETDDVVRDALPVRQRKVYVRPIQQPFIESVASQSGSSDPIVPTSVLVLSGKRLRGDPTNVLIGGFAATPTSVTDSRITSLMPSKLRAGPQGVQVSHPVPMGSPALPHEGAESNLAAFVLHPVINKRLDGTYDITIVPTVPPPVSIPVSLPAPPDGTRSADVTVKVSPKVALGQRPALLMSEFQPAAPPGHNYTFANPPLTLPGAQTETDTLVFHIREVLPGDYLVRVQVDGANSQLDLDSDPNNPRFIAPKVTIL
jgi:hypothetical protein